jgi:hypothetical protein
MRRMTHTHTHTHAFARVHSCVAPIIIGTIESRIAFGAVTQIAIAGIVVFVCVIMAKTALVNIYGCL